MPSLQQLNSSDNGPASLTKLNANFTALGTSTLTDAQVAAGATGVPGLTASGALVDKNGSSVSGALLADSAGVIDAMLGRIARAVGGASTQISVLQIGDSVFSWVSGYLVSDLVAKFGQAGRGVGHHVIQASTGSPTTASGDYTYWPEGNHITIPAGSSVTLQADNGGGWVGNQYRVGLVTAPGGGSAQVDLVLQSDSSVSATQTVSTAGAAVAGQVVALSHATVAQRRIKITASAGPVIVVAAWGWDSTLSAGVVNHQIQQPGVALSSYNGANASVLNAVLAAAAPQICTWSMREQGQTGAQSMADYLGAHLPALLGKVAAASPGCKFLTLGPTAGVADAGLAESAAPSYQEGEIIRALAAASGWAYFSGWRALGNWEAINGRGDPGDGVHVSASEQRLLASKFFAASGWTDVIGAMSVSGVRATEVQGAYIRTLRGTDFPATAMGRTTSNSGGYDQVDVITRWQEVRSKTAGGRLGLRVSCGDNSGDAGEAVILGSGAGCDVAGLYEHDGMWSIKVDPTTGVVKAYGKVAGALKTLTLGTLA